MNVFIMALLGLLISTIPGIYLAAKNNFLMIPNPKYNRFAIRLFYCALPLIPLTLLLALFPFSLILVVFFDNYPHLADEFSYLYLLCPLLSAISWIFLLKKFIVSTDIPFELRPDFMDHELYVFMPHIRSNGINKNRLQTYSSHDRKNIEYSKKSRQSKDPIVGKQTDNLVLNFNCLNKINYLNTGEFIVSDEALEIFQKKNLTGYQIQPVSNLKKSSSDSGKQYHQIVPLYTMPAFNVLVPND